MLTTCAQKGGAASSAVLRAWFGFGLWFGFGFGFGLGFRFRLGRRGEQHGGPAHRLGPAARLAVAVQVEHPRAADQRWLARRASVPQPGPAAAALASYGQPVRVGARQALGKLQEARGPWQPGDGGARLGLIQIAGRPDAREAMQEERLGLQHDAWSGLNCDAWCGAGAKRVAAQRAQAWPVAYSRRRSTARPGRRAAAQWRGSQPARLAKALLPLAKRTPSSSCTRDLVAQGRWIRAPTRPLRSAPTHSAGSTSARSANGGVAFRPALSRVNGGDKVRNLCRVLDSLGTLLTPRRLLVRGVLLAENLRRGGDVLQMGRSWLGLLLAGALGILLGCGLTAHLLTAPRVSSLVEGHSLATIDELGARLTTQENLQVGKPSIEHGADAKKGTEPAGEEDEEKEEEEEEDGEEEEGKEFGGIFALEEVDPLSISMLLIGLIVVTIGYEQAVDLLQEHVFSSGIGKLLLGKMARELTKPKGP